MGHDTRTGGATSSIPPAVLTWTWLLQRGAGAKIILFYFIFAALFCGTHFCNGHAAENSYFLHFFYFAVKQHLAPGINFFVLN